MDNKCEARVCPNGWHFRPCGKKAKVTRDSKHYCGIHDPVRLEERSKEREAKRMRCPNGHIKDRSWWAYCPLCGSKF